MSTKLKEVWDSVYAKQEWGKYPAECLIRFIAKKFYNTERDKVKILEVGCGPGANIWYFAREGFQAYGIDISPIAIKKAKERLADEKLSADLLSGDIKKLPYPDKSFDCVVDNECLYCNSLKNTKIILQEIKRVLKDGGLFFSRTFTDEMYVGHTQNRISSLEGNIEYNDISDGPFNDKGFGRLINLKGIMKLYGTFFKIVSIDKMEYTCNNSVFKVSEWLVVCRKDIENCY